MAIHPSKRPAVSRLTVTGAAGGIGTALRGKIGHLANEIILSDLTNIPVSGNETSLACDLTDLEEVRSLLRGGGDVLHFGGQAVEAPFERILNANLVGTYNLYEAARLEGVRRVLFASSNHAIGFHSRETVLDADSPFRPDSLYGVSKVYGEAVARLYHDKFGIESLILRIGSCFPEPADRRQLATWLAIEDLVGLVECMLRVPRLGCPVVYGVSDNKERWWDNGKTEYLGWRPQHSSESHRTRLEETTQPPNPDAPETFFQGGAFVTLDHPG